MYIRATHRRYKDKTYTNHLLVESVSTPKGPRQRTVCSLGDLSPRPRSEWLKLAYKIEAALVGQGELFSEIDAEVEEVVGRVRERQVAGERSPDDSCIAVRPDLVDIERCREAGPAYVGHEFWGRLGLGEILTTVGLSPQATRLACAMTLNRLIQPRSEHAMPGWMRSTAVADIVRVNTSRLADDSLYRMLDLLHPRREKIETALAERERTLFNLDGAILFYDLTSTYFEGQGLRNPKAQRGYSRDHRPDCKQVVVGLVIGSEGFPQAHEVFKGSMQDRQSLGLMLDAVERRVGPVAGRTVVVDRGMSYDDNLATIKEKKLHYIVASRQSERGQWLADFEDMEAFKEIVRTPSPNNPAQKKSRVWVMRREVGDELHVLCRSAGRIAKDRAIREKQEGRLLADLAKLAARVGSGQLVKERAIGEAIGRLKERYPRVARYWPITFDAESRQLEFACDEAKRQQAEMLDGCYLLRTDRKDLSTEEAWKIYIALTRVEDAFRDMKSPLAERPIFHQLERRVETHIFLCLLAYHLLVAIENTLAAHGELASWGTVRDTLRSHQIATAVLPTEDGAVLRIRKASKPEPEHARLYKLLDLAKEIITPRRTWSNPTPTAK